MRLKSLSGRQAAPYLFLLPTASLLTLFVLYPLLRSGLLSFQNWHIFSGEATWMGARNYTAVFADPLFWTSLKNTAYYTLSVVPLAMACGLALAVLLNGSVPLRGFFRSAYFFPTVCSTVVVSLVWRFLFTPGDGAVATLLTALGLQHLPNWLGDRHWAMPIVILLSVWKGLGYTMVIFLAGLQGIPAYVFEAARMDGAANGQLFRYITLPLLRPTTLFISIVMVIDSFKVFDQVYVMTEGGPGYATMTIVQYIYRAAFQIFDMGRASAAAWALFLIIFVLTVLQYRFTRLTGEER
jgi:multiple sugar transport system permease protein